jgi:O-antigen ligase
MVQNKIKISIIKNNFIAFIAFTLPLNKSLIPILIVITLFISLLEGGFKEKIQQLKNPYLFLAIGFYFMHLVAMLYTSNIKAGNFDLEQKLSLFVFPLIFFTNIKFNFENLTNVLKSFVFGCILSGILCVINALFKFYISGDTDVFFYSQFSIIMHTSYFAMYLCCAFIFVLFKDGIISNTPLKTVVLLFFMVLIVLIASKSGILSLAFAITIKFFQDIFIHKSYKRVLIMSILVLVSTIALYFIFPKSVKRLVEMKQTITSSNSSEMNTTSSRIVVWESALNIISQHFITGVGTGDVNDALKKEYENGGVDQLIEKKLNAHNQYLQTFIALGLLGILALLSLLIAIIYFTIKVKLWEGALLSFVIIINMLFESMLETQAGVVFIAFFLMLYFSIATQNIKTKNSIIAP